MIRKCRTLFLKRTPHLGSTEERHGAGKIGCPFTLWKEYVAVNYLQRPRTNIQESSEIEDHVDAQVVGMNIYHLTVDFATLT